MGAGLRSKYRVPGSESPTPSGGRLARVAGNWFMQQVHKISRLEVHLTVDLLNDFGRLVHLVHLFQVRGASAPFQRV